jgi:hypothetical protein
VTDYSNDLVALHDLLEEVFEDRIDEARAAQLEELLKSDRRARREYLSAINLHGALLWGLGGQSRCDATPELSKLGPELSRAPHVEAEPLGASCELSSTVSPHLPTFPAFPTPIQDPVGFFASDWSVAYLIATVVCGIGALVGSLVYVSHYEQVVDKSPYRAVERPLDALPKVESVARITGMVDCKWADPKTAPVSADVGLGRSYQLVSGLLEITYYTGAKVLLQGPVAYEVESSAGGYLFVGKLTARVEKRGERREERGEGKNISKSPNLQVAEPSPLSSLPSPLFAVRTPTATVTDLGTEFGVEVDKRGVTSSHVFRGLVRLQVVAVNGAAATPAITLRENESVRVEKDAGKGLMVRHVPVDPRVFTRQLIGPPKVIDLLDIVAGGNGAGHERERGIDPSTAMEDPLFAPGFRGVGRNYQRATTYRLNLIDGIFLADGSQGAVQLDSAGHTFLGFPKAVQLDSAGNTVSFPKAEGPSWGSFWARAAAVKQDHQSAREARQFVYCIDGSERFTPGGRGLFCLAPTMGITFNIEAMRKAYSGLRPARFRAVAGVGNVSAAAMPDEGRGDYWVFVDGQLKLKRMQVGPRDGVVAVDIELGPNDRFLTLVNTDSANERGFGYVIFGDPVLELVPVEEGRL